MRSRLMKREGENDIRIHAQLRRGAEAGGATLARARYLFAISGLVLALAVGLGTPALAHTLAHSWTLPIQPALVGVGVLVALAFLAAGWMLGRRVDTLADEARRDP